jgi:hypothetical protein
MPAKLEPDLPGDQTPADKNDHLGDLLKVDYLNKKVTQILRKETPNPAWEITWESTAPKSTSEIADPSSETKVDLGALRTEFGDDHQ